MIIFKTLNKRAIEIIVVLLKHKTFLLQDLAYEFQVSERTIRYDIDKINTILKKEGITGIQKEGIHYYISLDEIERIRKTLKKYGELSSDDRIDYIILKLLSENSIKLAQEANFLGVSRKTLAKDMSQVKEIFEREKLKVQGFAGIGIKIEGKEYDIRVLFSKYILKLLIKQNILNSTLKNMLMEYKSQVKYESIEKFVKEILKSLKKRAPSYSFYALVAVTMVSKLRFNFKDISLDEILLDREEQAETMVKTVVIEKYRWETVKKKGEKILDFPLENSDINILAKITKETDSHFNDYFPFFQESVKLFLLKLEERISEKMNLDQETKNNLCLKLSIGKLKVKYDILERSFSSKELGENYFKLFIVIKEITQEMFGYINDEDLISVTILLKEFILQNRKDIKIKKVIIVDNLHLDQWLGKLFSKKLAKLYEVEIVDIIPFYELENKKGEGDLIISLSPIENKDIDIPVIYINYFELYKNMDLLESSGLQERN